MKQNNNNNNNKNITAETLKLHADTSTLDDCTLTFNADTSLL